MAASLPRRKGPPASLLILPAAYNAVAQGPCSASILPTSDSVTLPQKARSVRNMKKLSLPSEPRSAVHIPPPQSAPRPRRPSTLSLPAAGPLLRKEEDGSPTVPYADGPIQIIPGIWLGSEDNARDWKGLVERGIHSVLNVAKEVSSPFDQPSAAQPLRPFASTPNLKSPDAPSTSYQTSTFSNARPPINYLKLQWSHGQNDLVDNGFPKAMEFTDSALVRGEGVLIHCQCGISRSATMVIALVMRAAAESSPNVPPEIWSLKGMQGAYDYVKEKSRWVGPNMSLIYQLMEYERRLKNPSNSPSASSQSSNINEEEEEWGRRRRLLDETPSDPEEQTADMREALALDKAMEDRMVARRSSQSSLGSTHSGQGIGMGAAWRSRYGSGRKRAGSVATTGSNRSSIISENLVEEDEETELLGIGGGFDQESRGRHSSSELGDVPSIESSPLEAEAADKESNMPPPSAPVWKTSFGSLPPPLTAIKPAFIIPKSAKRLSAQSTISTDSDVTSTPRPRAKGKKRPPSLSILSPVPPSPITIDRSEEPAASPAPLLATVLSTSPSPSPPPPPPLPQESQPLPSFSARRRTESRKPAPPPLHLRNANKRHSSYSSIDSTHSNMSSMSHTSVTSQTARTSVRSRTSSRLSQQPVLPPPTATQTLFVFPPSPTQTRTRTPSTMTLMSMIGANNQSVPFPSLNTPRISTFETKGGRRRSFIGLGMGVAPTPTTATSRVDARGWIGVE